MNTLVGTNTAAEAQPNRAPTSTSGFFTLGNDQQAVAAVTASSPSPIELRLIGTDPDGDPVRYELVGALPAQLSLDSQTGRITYTPSDADLLMNKYQTSNLSLSYRVSDGELVSGIQRASLTVFGANEPTTFIGGNFASVAEGPNPNFSGAPLSYQSGYITLSTPNPLYPEQNFKPFSSTDQFGTFTLEASGAWHYKLDTSNPALQRMTSNDIYVMSQTGFVTYDGVNFAAPYDKTFYVTIYGSDVYQGDAANNHYLGGYLDDQMSGLAGQDTFYGGAGNDQLLGGENNDFLYGEEGDDILDGGTGVDSMDGGAGNDTYYVDHRHDVVVEEVGTELSGQDQVYSSIDYTLGAGVEWLQLTGRDSLDGTGNAADNRITGNQGHNHLSGLSGNDQLNGGGGNDFLEGGTGDDALDGGLGKDLMHGGEGDDQYYVSTLGDYTFEWANQGYDTVHSSISWTLAHHVEALNLTGEQNINATGNSADNLLIGNSGNNRIDGKLGDNQLIGAAGDDLYIVKRGYGLNEIQESAELDGGMDQVVFGYGISAQQLWFSQSNQDLLIEVIGSETQVLIKDWYGTAAGAVESFQLDNGQQLSASQVQVLVSAMADMSPEVIGRSLSRPQYRALEGVFNSTWGNMAG